MLTSSKTAKSDFFILANLFPTFFFLVLSVLTIVCAILLHPLYNITAVEEAVFWGLLFLVFISISFYYSQCYHVTLKGINIIRFFVFRRFCAWEDIQNAMLLRNGSRDKTCGILLTFRGGIQCIPLGKTNKQGHADNTFWDLIKQNKGLARSILQRKNAYLLFTSLGSTTKIISILAAKGIAVENTGIGDLDL